MKRWMVSAKRADFNEIAKTYQITPMLARIIRNRDVIGDEAIKRFLYGSLKDLYAPTLMKDVETAAELLLSAIDSGKKMRIIGDYDIDGVCASYILLEGLKAYGATVDVRLPDRVKDGYGINEAMITEAKEDGTELLITCDNGIAADKEIAYAKKTGMIVLVTDHHEVPYEEIDGVRHFRLPPADAIIDPKQPECQYPYQDICGALVAYKLIMRLHEKRKPDAEVLEELLSFAAFATVGDVMPLLDENRIVVKYGMEQMKHTSNLGLKALIDVTKTDREKLSPYLLGFVLGPCINATGRLDTAERALQLFCSESMAEAVQTANELKQLNDSRKDMTQLYTQMAYKIVEEREKLDCVLVVYLPDCHESLAGIVAGRLKERYYRPSFVLTKSEDGVKGSGRSIDTYSMYEEMTKCRELFTKFGGHRMAAGLSMREADIDEFRKRLNDNASLTIEDMTEKITIDIPMPINCITELFIQELDKLAPFGTGNPRPLFAHKNVEFKDLHVMGKNRNVAKLKLYVHTEPESASKPESESKSDFVTFEGVYFGEADVFEKELAERNSVSIVYYPEINHYMGRSSIQIVIRDYC